MATITIRRLAGAVTTAAVGSLVAVTLAAME